MDYGSNEVSSDRMIWDKFFYTVNQHGGGVYYSTTRHGGHWDIKIGDTTIQTDHPNTEEILRTLIRFEASLIVIQERADNQRRREREERRARQGADVAPADDPYAFIHADEGGPRPDRTVTYTREYVAGNVEDPYMWHGGLVANVNGYATLGTAMTQGIATGQAGAVPQGIATGNTRLTTQDMARLFDGGEAQQHNIPEQPRAATELNRPTTTRRGF